MILPKPADAVHRGWLYRLLSALADDVFLVSVLRFKGGTCAAMRSLLDRFSIDLDFDLLDPKATNDVRRHLEKIFPKIDLKIDQKSIKAPQYFLKYENRKGERNTIELDISFPAPKSNEYEPVRFTEIDRILHCHTVPTMFANKLVTIVDRYERFGSLAGRDIFDIHVFFFQGFPYRSSIIQERTGQKVSDFFQRLHSFIKDRFTQVILDQDLNMLLPVERFRNIRKVLKQEVLMFLRMEIERLAEK